MSIKMRPKEEKSSIDHPEHTFKLFFFLNKMIYFGLTLFIQKHLELTDSVKTTGLIYTFVIYKEELRKLVSHPRQAEKSLRTGKCWNLNWGTLGLEPAAATITEAPSHRKPVGKPRQDAPSVLSIRMSPSHLPLSSLV